MGPGHKAQGADFVAALEIGSERPSLPQRAADDVQQSGIEPLALSSADFQAQIAREIVDNAALAKALNMKVN